MSTYSETVLADQPTGYWRLGEASGTTAMDSSGFARHGVYQNGVQLAQPGLLASDGNTAARFDGVDDQVDLPGGITTFIGSGTNSLSIEAWVQITSGETNGHVFVFVGPTQTLELASGHWRFRLSQSGGPTVSITDPATAIAETPYHLVGTLDWPTKAMRLYVNGTVVAVGTFTGTNILSGAAWIGRDGTNNLNALAALIDDVAIYPAALSPARVRTHYEIGRQSATLLVPDLGTIGAARHRLAFDHLASLDLQQWPASSPWAPYRAEPLFYLLNHFGLRLFSMWQMPDSLTAFVQEDRPTLLAVSGFSVNSAPLQNRLLSAWAIAERPQIEVVLNNRDGYWDQLMEREALLAMPAGLYVFVRRAGIVPMIVGTVGEIELTGHRATLRIGDFSRPEELDSDGR